MINPPKATKPPEIKRKAIMDWANGTVTDYDARRLVDNSLLRTTNVVLEQNGVVRPRPSLVPYGPQPIGRVLGELFECKVMEGNCPVFYLLAMMVVDGKANVYRAKGEDAAWQKIDGKDYDTEATAHFLLTRNNVLVLNGIDTLSYVDTVKWKITEFKKLEKPKSAPTLKEAHELSGDAFKVYYAVTANSTVGETEGSAVLTQQISTQRDMWDPDKNWVTIQWDRVEGAVGYNVYMGTAADGAGQPELYLIAGNLDPETLVFTDNGSRAQDLGRGPMPTYNSTAGPKAKRGAVINGRVWLVGDADNPFYLWRGGDYDHELDFSPSNGGGFTAIANGTKEVPISVMPFRKGQGDNTVVVLTQGSNGSGKRYHLSPNTISYGGGSFVAWSVSEDSGSDGTDSPDGVVIYNNSLYYPSRDGFKTTGTQPQLQNVLSTSRISNTIKNEVSLLNTNSMDKAVGLAYEGIIYWALPLGSTKNNRIWAFDLEHKGAWILSWYLNADWMTLYNDNSGKTHFLILSDNKIYELTRLFNTRDGEGSFETEIKSGKIEWSKDGRDWARLIQVVFTLLKPRGDISIEISAYTEDGELKWTQAVNVPTLKVPYGWSEPKRSWSSLRKWSDIGDQLSAANKSIDSLDVMVEIDEDVQWFDYQISSTAMGVDYTLASVVAEYVPIGIKDLS